MTKWHQSRAVSKICTLVAGAAFLMLTVGVSEALGSGSYTWSWDVDDDALGWTLDGTATGLDISGGIVSFTSTGDDPMWISPAGLGLNANSNNTLILRFKNGSAQTHAGLYWRRNNESEFPNYKAIPVVANDSGFTTYTVDLSTSTGWTGTIYQLRLDLPQEESSGALIELDWVDLQYTAGLPPTEYIDNGIVKLGVNLGVGGAITYIADSQTGKNIVNNYDWGRQIQMSFFGHPIPYIEDGKAPAPQWEHIGWNPIQAGDDYGNGSTVVDFQKSATNLYVKCIPMQWPLNNVPGECTYECWIELKDNTAQVRTRFINARSDHNRYNGRHQELPAVYSNGEFYKLMTYRGDQPFTGDAVVRIPKKTGGGFPWDYWLATENWAALVDTNDWGLGIYKPENYFFIGGYAGTEGQGGTYDSQTGYIAPLHTEILDHNIVYEYSYTLILGDLTEIRDYAVSQGQGMGLPDWHFEKDRQNWHYQASWTSGTDAGWPINEYIELDLGKLGLTAISPARLWQAEEAPLLYINAAFNTSRTRSRVAWTKYETDAYNPSFPAENRAEFDIIGDGQFRTYAIDLTSVASYTGPMSYLAFAPVLSTDAGGWVKIKRIWFGTGASATTNGTPHAWLDLYYPGLMTEAEYENADASDTDGDGFTAGEEHIAGTVPTDPESLLRIESTEPVATNSDFVFQWNAVSGRVYSVYGTTNLMESFNLWATNIVHPQNTFTDSVHSAGDSAFYKIEVELGESSGGYTWSWDTDGDALGWTLGGTATDLDISGGIISFTSTGNDPMWISPAGLAIDANSFNTLTLRFKNTSARTQAGLYWDRDQETGFANYKDIPIVANDTGFTTYTVYLSTSTGWTGTINRLRLDLPQEESSGARIELDWVDL
jgi:hypothetical protein